MLEPSCDLLPTHACVAMKRLDMLAPATPAPFAIIGIAIPEVKPHSPIIAKDSPNLPEHGDQRGDVVLGCGFEADLAFDLIIPEVEVRR